MKKILYIFLLFTLICIPMLEATTATITPYKISTIPATTIYWGLRTFGRGVYTPDTLVFSKARGFSTTGESTAIFVSRNTATGVLTATVLNDSSFIVSSTVVTDSTGKSYWYLIFRK